MSYCRFGEADAYIFAHIAGGYECCACLLSEVDWGFVHVNTPEEMLNHIDKHRQEGHHIPLDVDERLRDEMK